MLLILGALALFASGVLFGVVWATKEDARLARYDDSNFGS